MQTPAKLVLTGPTCAGKTAFVNTLLEQFPIDVINMDSIQVYAFFRVGPARRDAAYPERRHLYGYLSPHTKLDIADYLQNAVALVHELEMAGRIPMFEGGSRSLLPELAKVLPLKMFGIAPSDDHAYRETRLHQRVESFFHDDALEREIRAGLQLGYGETQLMTDPLIYMQMRDHLAGRRTLETCKQDMLTSLWEMQEDQMVQFSRLPITWVRPSEMEPTGLAQLVRTWLIDQGRMAA